MIYIRKIKEGANILFLLFKNYSCESLSFLSSSFFVNFLFISVVFLQITSKIKANSYINLATTFPTTKVIRKPMKFEPIIANEERVINKAKIIYTIFNNASINIF